MATPSRLTMFAALPHLGGNGEFGRMNSIDDSSGARKGRISLARRMATVPQPVVGMVD